MQQQEANDGRFLERVSLADKNTAVFQEHLLRYQFALPFAENRMVLDAATGTRYGAALLANTANWVVGVDIEAEAEALLQDFFPKVELFGQWRGEKALQVMHGTPLKQRLRKFDPFGLRNLLPVSLYHFLLRLIRAPVAEDLRTQDYEIRREEYGTADYLLAVCTKL